MLRTELWLKRLCAVTLILLMQGPAMLVQEVAWAKMLGRYCSENGLARGVVRTFDGKHPCKMCAKAEELRNSEGKSQPLNQSQEKKPNRFTWGEMVNSNHLVVPKELWIDCLLPLACSRPLTEGCGKDSPVVSPPELA